ncbi:MAG: GNAT family N-acetyltransferase, partial [Planctomycetes bacterium]|nr:GNAT family N-acetyltransferase [Planctomycetota bacterium]
AARGQGYGTALLAAGAKYAREAGFVRRVCGYVKRTNQASLRCFEKAGFVRREDSQVNGMGCAAFEWPE